MPTRLYLSLARQAAVPPPRNYRYIRIQTEKPSKTYINRSENCAESMTKRPWKDGGAETRFWWGGRKPWYPRGDSGALFWVANRKKDVNNAINKSH